MVASGDRVANDIVGLSVVKMYGLWDRVADIDVWEQTQIRRAVKLGLGRGRGGVKMVGRLLTGDEESSMLINRIREVAGLEG